MKNTKAEKQWINWQKQRPEKIRANLNRNKAKETIDSLIAKGYRVQEFTRAHFRFEECFDVYTRNYRWHDLWTDERGDFVCERQPGSANPTLEEIVFARVAKPVS